MGKGKQGIMFFGHYINNSYNQKFASCRHHVLVHMYKLCITSGQTKPFIQLLRMHNKYIAHISSAFKPLFRSHMAYVDLTLDE